MSSEYQFEIFISSTESNLLDLRGELESWLLEAGYKPVLSSSSGFPDFGEMAPWESCLKRLEPCQLVLLIIDGKYGEPKDWPHFKDVIKERVSPTHGEYLFARAKNKRLLIFVRSQIAQNYERFFEAHKRHGGDLSAIKQTLFLPDHITVEALQFLHEIKSAKTVPWYRTFGTVSDIKHEIRRQILNELVMGFQAIHETRIEYLLERVESATAKLSQDDRYKILQAFDLTKDFVQEFESTKAKLEENAKLLESKDRELSLLGSKERKPSQDELVESLRDQVATLKRENKKLDQQFSKLKDQGVAAASGSIAPMSLPVSLDWATHSFQVGVDGSLIRRQCNSCHGNLGFENSRTCQTCKQEYCTKCWPVTQLAQNKCPGCAVFFQSNQH